MGKRINRFLYKEKLDNFCLNWYHLFEEFMKSKYSTYFPAKLWHERTGRSKPLEGILHTFDDFYTQCAKSVWDAVLSTGKLKRMTV